MAIWQSVQEKTATPFLTILMQEGGGLVELRHIPEGAVTSAGHLLGHQGLVLVCCQHRVTALHPPLQGQHAYHVLQGQVGSRDPLLQEPFFAPCKEVKCVLIPIMLQSE
ncbi:hypothetical protein E2C01_009516 [Portunus trituberculatus]|uniref:Uncharacterized protein n=1 Tax=Portunus trituberculatus TaxID=210409 RepID=A0A5B7D600_PORTR|nr:hypothetical protein [Portunus trituberculatus]